MIINVSDPGEIRRTEIGDCEVLDHKIIRYPNGKIFVRYLYKNLLEKLAEDMHRNISRGYDNVIGTEGPEGSGKSNLAWQCCRRYDPDFDFNTQYVYSMEEFKQKLNAGDDVHAVFWCDEATYMANNREWQSQDNRDLVTMLEMMRSRGWTLNMCIPTVERLDVYIREHRLRYILRCGPAEFDRAGGYKERGFFELLRRNAAGKMIHVGYGTFDPMPEDVKLEYEKRKLASQQIKIKEVVESKGAGAKYKAKWEAQCKLTRAAMLYMHENKLMSDDDLMAFFGYENKGTFANALSRSRKEAAGDDE